MEVVEEEKSEETRREGRGQGGKEEKEEEEKDTEWKEEEGATNNRKTIKTQPHVHVRDLFPYKTPPTPEQLKNWLLYLKFLH